jgi:uncharacterized protein YkwD
MWTGRVIAALCVPLIAMGAAGGVAAQRQEAQPNAFAHQLLALHNRARDDAGVPRLTWSSKLAREAQGWAERLARDGRMYHSNDEQSGGAGENLWMGSAGYYGPETMIGAFVDEKQHYVHAAFPQVSNTGRWEDVGHYTQVVWRSTQQVGCAVARGAKDDFLVCRYWPAGNWMGQLAY